MGLAVPEEGGEAPSVFAIIFFFLGDIGNRSLGGKQEKPRRRGAVVPCQVIAGTQSVREPLEQAGKGGLQQGKCRIRYGQVPRC